tara:strand:- start:436 stop:588 length:153 start_codon:yes stop_codon:yes gene_type:complete
MIDHFEKMDRHLAERRKGKIVAALVTVLIGISMMLTGGAMALALMLLMAE